MAAIEINWKPTDRQLRQFGWGALAILPAVAWFVSGRPGISTEWTSTHIWIVGGAAAAGLLAAICAAVAPQLLKWVFLGIMIVAFPIGLVVSEVILLLIYALVFVPVGLVFRLMRRDALERTIDHGAKTYWADKPQAGNASSYFRQS